MRWRRPALYVLLGLVALFAVIQLVPYGRDHSNPPVVNEPQWTDPQAQQLVEAACYDCHSNKTNWPWYASVAPASWLLQFDVNVGRDHLNFSEFDRYRGGGEGAGEAAEAVQEGGMPPIQYKILHSEARLSAAERQTIVDEFNRIF